MTDQRAPLYILSSEEPLLKQDRSSQLLQTARTQLPHASYLIFTEADFKSAGGPANLARLENELRDPGLFGGDRILKLYFKEYDNTAVFTADSLQLCRMVGQGTFGTDVAGFVFLQ